MSTPPPEPPRPPSAPLPPPPPTAPRTTPPGYPPGAPPPPVFGAVPGSHPPAPDARKPPYDPVSVAAFVCGVLPLIPFAFVLGIVGIFRAKPGVRRGRILAILAIVLSVLWTVGIAVGVAVAINEAFANRDESGRIVEAGKVRLDDLRAGDCLKDFQESEAFLVTDAVPCSETHAAEIFAAFDLPAGAYPGVDGSQAASERGCGERIPAAVQQGLQDGTLGIAYYYPQEAGWERGDRQVLCVVTGEKGPLAKSYTGSA
jgi:hypothetical protein